jgi:hypothetical protein
LTHLNLSDGQVEEGVAFSDLDDGLGADAAHARSETAVQLEHDELIEESGAFGLFDVVVMHDLFRIRRVDSVPVASSALQSEDYISFPFALSLRYRWKSAKKLSISIRNFCMSTERRDGYLPCLWRGCLDELL